MVRCSDGSLYTGATPDLVRRVAAHNAGKGARYTRSRRPVVVVWRSRPMHKRRALSLEALIKRLSRADKLVIALGPPALRARIIRPLMARWTRPVVTGSGGG